MVTLDVAAQAVPCVITDWARLPDAAVVDLLDNFRKSETPLEATFTNAPGGGRVMLRDFVKSLDSDYVQKYCYSVSIKELSEFLWN